jgi:hypothetical protein
MRNRYDARQTTIRHRYVVRLDNGRRLHSEDYIDRKRAARLVFICREVGQKVYVKHSAQYIEYTANLCAGCYARPSLWEMDCDGLGDTVKCGECDWWAAHDARWSFYK